MSTNMLTSSAAVLCGNSIDPTSSAVFPCPKTTNSLLSLTNETSVPMLVQLASQMTPLEINAPILRTSTKKGFELFFPLFQAYVTKRGMTTLPNLMTVNVQIVYAVRLSVSLAAFLLMTSEDLKQAIFCLHKINVIGIGFTNILESITMQESLEYDRTKCEIYLEKFLALLTKVPSLRDSSSGGATE